MPPNRIASLILSFVATLVAGQTSIDPAQSIELSILSSYTAQSKFTSVESVLQTGIPPSVIQVVESGGAAAIISLVGAASTPPAWFTSLPTDIQSDVYSLISQESAALSSLTASTSPSTATATAAATTASATQTSTTAASTANAAPVETGMIFMMAGVAGAAGVAAILL